MKAIFQGWNIMRAVKLGLGIAVLIQGIVSKDISLTILGALFTAMPVLNVGCCGANSCPVDTKGQLKDNLKENTHESVDVIK